MKTTLNKIRAHHPCTNGWEKLLKNLGKTKADDEPLCISTILESNGFVDAVWCLRGVDGHDREIRLFAVECARAVQHLMQDERSIRALDVSERFANGLATKAELNAARDAARDAARGVEWGVRGAAFSAAKDDAWDAAEYVMCAYASRDVAWDAAGEDAVDAAGEARANLLLLTINGCFGESK